MVKLYQVNNSVTLSGKAIGSEEFLTGWLRLYVLLYIGFLKEDFVNWKAKP
jgi:hypothetical protein